MIHRNDIDWTSFISKRCRFEICVEILNFVSNIKVRLWKVYWKFHAIFDILGKYILYIIWYSLSLFYFLFRDRNDIVLISFRHHYKYRRNWMLKRHWNDVDSGKHLIGKILCTWSIYAHAHNSMRAPTVIRLPAFRLPLCYSVKL